MTNKSNFLLFVLLLIPCSLLSLRFLVNNDFRLLSQDYYNSSATINYPDGRELLKGEKFNLSFKSKYNHLGTFSLRFDNNFKTSNDTLLFSIKESGSKETYYQAQYKTDQFLPKRLFDFGFPVIEESKNKTYEIEIVSLYGSAQNGIIVDSTKPVYLARSIYSKKEILKDPSIILPILKSKLEIISTDKNYLLHLLIYFLPIILLFVSWLTATLSIHYMVIFYFLSCYFSFKLSRDLADLFVVNFAVYWLYLAHHYRIPQVYTLVTALSYLCLGAVFYPFNPILANSFSVWFYLLLIIYLIEAIFKIRSHLTSKINLKIISREAFNFSHDSQYSPSHLTALTLKGIVVIYFTSKVFEQLIGAKNLIFNLVAFGGSHLNVIFVLTSFLFFWLLIIWLAKKWIVSNEKVTPLGFKIMVTVIAFILVNNYLVAANSKQINTPTIFSVSPNDTSEAWVDVSIKGGNFGNPSFVGKVYIDGKEQDVISEYWRDKTVIFRTNPINTKSGNLCLETYKGVLTNCVAFFYNFSNK